MTNCNEQNMNQSEKEGYYTKKQSDKAILYIQDLKNDTIKVKFE